MYKRDFFIAGLLLFAVTLTYSNHFHNDFHFDDDYRITQNVYIRDLHNLPRFFTDATTSATLPQLYTWRPLVTASFAFDYWLGHGYDLFYFHLSTLIWFLAQLLLMYCLFVSVLDKARPGDNVRPPGFALNGWIAWFAVAWYGLHPVMAETVNYINQRADSMSTCGVVAAMVLFIRFPGLRRYGIYLLPFVLALFCKEAALVFPVLPLIYIFLFEERFDARGLRAALGLAPAFAISVAFELLRMRVAPGSYIGALPAYDYIITQPYVAFRYVTSLFLPIHLSADTDLRPLTSILTLEGLGGLAFLAAVLYAIYAAARRIETRPIAFGLAWFLTALIPTSLFPLPEVETDHRLFFPFIGLVLAVTWAGALLLLRQPLRRESRLAATLGLLCVLALSAAGTRRRNEVWRTDESLWQDVTIKSPYNGRGLMNYGLALMSKGDFLQAEQYFERAQQLLPAYPILEINLGINLASLGRDSEAEQHFQRAVQLAPELDQAHYYYARWLRQQGRGDQAEQELKVALVDNPANLDARYLLLEIYAQSKRASDLQALAAETRRISPGDPTVERYLNPPQAISSGGAVPVQATPESLLADSLRYYQEGNFPACIQAARDALQLRPDYAEAYNNIAVAEQALGHLDAAIQAAHAAIRINPKFQLARNNLAAAEQEKRQTKVSPK